MHELIATESARVQGVEHFGKAGVTFPSKAVLGFNPRLQPTGSAFGHSGSVAFPRTCSPYALLGFLASRPIEYILSLYLGAMQGEPGVHPNHYEVGTIQRLPWPDLSESDLHCLNDSARTCVIHIQGLFESDETSRMFVSAVEDTTASVSQGSLHLAERVASAIRATDQLRRSLDSVVGTALGFTESDLLDMENDFGRRFPPATGPWRLYFSSDWDEDMGPEYVRRLFSWLVGCAFGRWIPTDTLRLQCRTEVRDPDDPPRLTTPAMGLDRHAIQAFEVGADATGATSPNPFEVVTESDLVRRVHDVMKAVWTDHSASIEEEVLSVLAVDRLTDYVCLESRFFADHLAAYSRFSNGRRRAPIYWPLSTRNGLYTLWLYYHQLTDQTLYTCVNDFVDPKLKQVAGTAAHLRRKDRRSRDEEKELERLTNLENDLTEYRDELLRIAKFWKPNLNDGVQLTAAPLWKLFRHRAWQSKLRETWEKLGEGEYDWAQLAMSVWPERVVPNCATDRSLAIAHDIENLFWVEDGDKWRNLHEPNEEIEEQKRRQQSPARDRALHLLEKLVSTHGAETAATVHDQLAAGNWDDQELALLIWPNRVAEKCWDDAGLAAKLKIQLPRRRTKAGKNRLVRERITAGCPELAEPLAAAFQSTDKTLSVVWDELATGNRDHEPLALMLWPERVIDKCLVDAELAERHGIAKYFWVRHPTTTWRRRVPMPEEIADEIARRQGKAAVTTR